MNLYLGVTNCNWFDYLSAINPEDVNFWQPSGKSTFRVLPLNGVFLFKLKKPYNAIGGLGFFRAQTQLPLSLAWDAFGVRNGVPNLDQFRTIIQKYRGGTERNPTIGCIALTDPVFFRREDWVPAPVDWCTSIVQGKRYSTDTAIGSALWQQVQDRLTRYRKTLPAGQNLLSVDEPLPQYGNSVLQKVRIGQGAFRLSVIDVYKSALEKMYGERLQDVVLYGSYVRGDYDDESDIDLLVVLNDNKVNTITEIFNLSDLTLQAIRQHGKAISALPVSSQRYKSSPMPVYQNARREGIHL